MAHVNLHEMLDASRFRTLQCFQPCECPNRRPFKKGHQQNKKDSRRSLPFSGMCTNSKEEHPPPLTSPRHFLIEDTTQVSYGQTEACVVESASDAGGFIARSSDAHLDSLPDRDRDKIPSTNLAIEGSSATT